MVTAIYDVPAPILSLRLVEYDLKSTQIGIIFAIEAIFYIVGTFMVPYIVPKWIEPRVTLLTASFLVGLATALVGPFYTEHSLVGMIVGLTCSGYIISFMMIPNMSEMMQAVKDEIPSCAGSNRTNSMLSGMFSGFSGAGQAVGPLLSAYFYDKSGGNFRLTMNIFGGLCLVFAMLYFFCAKGYQAFTQTCKNRGRFISERQLAEAKRISDDQKLNSSEFARTLL